jgi:hypothetical protein
MEDPLLCKTSMIDPEPTATVGNADAENSMVEVAAIG